tara:strand:+ start:438 stop:986 length:549 start_codon:yes stop_codon:yes gene_type:complete
MGPPGVGKGTQAKKLKSYFNIYHLSTGKVLRNEINKKTEIGVISSTFIDKGELVPDHILLKIVKKHISKKEYFNGYILDGFPRTITQAKGLDRILSVSDQKLNAVVSLKADKEELISRLILRSKKSTRSDDNLETIKNRQKIYWEQTSPLLEYYRSKQILKQINGVGEISEITNLIIQSIKS